MMRKLLGAAAVALALSGCSNQYFERKDTVTFSAGDAVAWNNAQMIPDPAPRSAYDTNIVTPGETAARAGNDYAQGRFRWFTEPAGVDEPKDSYFEKGTGQGGTTPTTTSNNNSNISGLPSGAPVYVPVGGGAQ